MGSVSPPQSYSQEFSDPTMSNSQVFSQYEFDSSDNAMSEYAKLMHKHTKQQLETASSSARRRSQGQGSTSTLAHESSNASRGSVSSTDS